MNKFKIVGNHIELEELPKKFKKLSGTRFATALDLNTWSSPFEVWCAVTRTYEVPFEGSIYTEAGKVIEDKIYDYLKSRYFMDIKSPTEVYGPDYFKKTWGDFFPQEQVFGGLWDFLGDDFVVEVKTTKRVEDWKGPNGEVEPPLYYKLQACLYAYLLGFDNVVMTCSFLEDKDYVNPELFEPNVSNTVVIEFKVSEAFPTFEETYVNKALAFWNDYVETGVSPEFDEKKDAEILKVLRKNVVEVDDKDIAKLMSEADKLQDAIEKAEDKLQAKKDRLKEIDELIKKHMSEQFRDGDKKVEVSSKKRVWTLTKSVRNSLDSTKLKKELPDVYGKYQKQSEVLTLKKSLIEEVA